MSSRARLIALASLSGLLAAVIVLVGARLLFGAGDDVDGEFVLDEPGIYAEPGIDVDRAGAQVPNVDLTDVDGAVVRLDRYRGAPLVVNIWFSQCAPCRRELADFAEVHAELGDRVQFVGVDPDDDVESMVDFASERGVTYDLLLDDRQEFVEAAGIAFYPTTLFVDSDGTIVHQSGAIDADDLRDAISDHLLGTS